VTAREATRKMVAAATQLDALQQIVTRIDAIAAEHNMPLVHMARPSSAGAPKAGGADSAGHHGLPAGQEDGAREELVPRSAAAVVQPNLWQPKNTIVRSAYREASSQVVAQRAAGPLAAAAAVAPVAPLPVAQSLAAAAAAAAAAAGAAEASGASAAAAGPLPAHAAGTVLQTPRTLQPGLGAAASAAAGVLAHRESSSFGGVMRSSASSGGGGYGGSIPAGALGGFSTPRTAYRGSSGGGGGGVGGGRHAQQEAVNCPLMVLQEGAAPEDTLMAAVQSLAVAQTPRTMYTPRRSSRKSSAGGN
jgi:hypothetical protein